MEQSSNSIQFSLIAQYALRDLRRNYKKISSIILTLFISLFILSAILTIEDSLKKELNDNARALLGGDVEIDYNRVAGDPALLNQVKAFATVSQMIEFSTMLSSYQKEKKASLFTRVKTVDELYPLYGSVQVQPPGALKRIHTEDKTILVNENIFNTLQLKIGETIKVQDQLFTVVGVIRAVPDVSGFIAFGDFALAGKQTLELMKLNNLGSFLNHEYKVRFRPGDNIKDTRNKIQSIFANDKKVILRYPENSASGLKRVINNFSQFLSLVSISAMLIAGIGIANTLMSFLNQNNMSIAVQKALGFPSLHIKAVYYLQLLLLLFCISVAAYLCSFFLIPVADAYLSQGLGLRIQAVFSWLNFTKIFLVGLMVLLLFSIPTINAIDQVKASNLFRNVFQNLEFHYSKQSIFISLFLLAILIMLFTVGSARPIYSLGYFAAFFLCLLVFFFLSKLIIAPLKLFQTTSNISFKTSIKNITQAKSITPITMMSLGLGVTLLLTLALVGTNFKREIAKTIPEIAPDYFFLGIQQEDKNIFATTIKQMDSAVQMEIVPIISSAITKINGIDPNTYIQATNDSYWVIGRERRSSWVDVAPDDNPIVAGSWWDLTRPDQLQISLDAKVARDFGIRLGDTFTLNIYGREIEGTIINFRAVNYRDLSINFAMLFNPSFAQKIPHEFLATVKFSKIDQFKESVLLDLLPSLSMIKISDYLNKVTAILNQIFIAVLIVSTITILIGLIVISSAIMVQGKIKEFQNLVFKILGFSKKEVVLSSVIEFLIIFSSVIFIAILFATFGSKFIIETIFNLVWSMDITILIYLSSAIGLITLLLIMITNVKYLNPKVYPLIRNQ